MATAKSGKVIISCAITGPATVASKMLDASDVLGGVARITFQMSTASLETAAMKRSIELLGTAVAPIVRAWESKT